MDIPAPTPASYSKGTYAGIFVCSDTTFLYKIGKISATHKLFIEDGLCALDDYLEFLRYEGQEEIKDRMSIKASFYKSLLMIETLKSDEGYKLMEEIMDDLRRLKLKKKLAQAEIIYNLDKD